MATDLTNLFLLPNPGCVTIVSPMAQINLQTDLNLLEHRLGHCFCNRDLLIQALTHPSSFNEATDLVVTDYQRLEFLGDAILGMLLAELLYCHFPEWSEGKLSRFRSRLVGQDSLADRARSIDLGHFIHLGKGEESSKGRCKDSILADVLESVLAAIYLDAGLEVARIFVSSLFAGMIESPESVVIGRDTKSELQEILVANGRPHPDYQLIAESGPPHQRLFHYSVRINGIQIGEGEGGSKKAAQQQAALNALHRLKSETPHL